MSDNAHRQLLIQRHQAYVAQKAAQAPAVAAREAAQRQSITQAQAARERAIDSRYRSSQVQPGCLRW